MSREKPSWQNIVSQTEVGTVFKDGVEAERRPIRFRLTLTLG